MTLGFMQEKLTITKRLRQWAATLKTNLQALYLCSRHPQTPWLATAIAIVVVAYALSPIDLIPDFIPVIGYLDDLLLVPAGIWLAIHLIPDPIWQLCREEALRHPMQLPKNRRAAIAVIICWLLLLALLLWLWLEPNSAAIL
ncbi:YkvA family protein [Mariprofundus sp. NF]|uniref:YkvA family protein n=1 Tax=Mariprofundus sp. NF TaxID=2608716 RepID=UPI001F50540B|nr:YkvA family protein [Mariprofundus sp. NF]